MIDRAQVADALEEIGQLLELLGENPFKTRAYENAARIVRGLDRDLGELIRTKELAAIKGLGPALVDKITVLVETGRLPYLEGLRSKFPQSLLEWLRIPGLGPKKARAIHINLGISTLDELEAAARENRLRDLPGFGATTETKILEGLARARAHSGRFLQPVVRGEANRLLAAVRAVPGVTRAEVAGSVRRRGDTAKDIDIVVAAESAATTAAMDAFCSAAAASTSSGQASSEVIGRGPTKCSIRLASGPNADLRVVEPAAFPFALLYFTGSKAHNIALRARAQKLGLKLNEYALIREADGSSIAAADEENIYRALGLSWIPPELREDRGEVEAAEGGNLPALIDESDLEGILHCHSDWSDGKATIEEMARAAQAMGVSYLGLCDHSRSAGYAKGLSIERLREQHAVIDELNRRFDGSFRVLKGIEVDILADGSLDYPDDVLESLELVVASVHSRFNLSAEEQTARILRAVTHPLVDIIGHVTGRLLLQRDPYPLELSKILDAAAERGVAVEINAHPNRLDLDDTGVRYAVARGMKTAINPDAHDTAGLADIHYGIGVARRGWCTANDVINAWPLPRLLDHLTERRRRARTAAQQQ